VLLIKNVILAWDVTALHTFRGPWMRRRKHKSQFIFKERMNVESVRLFRFQNDGQVNLVVLQRFHGIGGVTGSDADEALWVIVFKFTQNGWQNISARRGTCADAETGLSPFAKMLQGISRGLHVA